MKTKKTFRGNGKTSPLLKAAVLVLSLSLCLTGCAPKADPGFTETEGTANGFSSRNSSQEYISKGAAVISGSGISKGDSLFNAGADLLVDETHGTVKYAKDPFKKLYPASTTKIITALLALENCNMNEMVTFSRKAVTFKDPTAVVCGFEEGDTIKLRDLMYCMLVFSGNDAAEAIAEHVSGSRKDFAALMNEKAASLGCMNSHFVNPNGLHTKNHYTCAYDLYLFFRQAVKYKLFVKIISTPKTSVHYKDKDGGEHEMTLTNTNSYLSGHVNSPSGFTVTGGKTGTTSDAGSCLVLLARRGNSSGNESSNETASKDIASDETSFKETATGTALENNGDQESTETEDDMDESGKKDMYISVVLKAPNTSSLYRQMSAMYEQYGR